MREIWRMAGAGPCCARAGEESGRPGAAEANRGIGSPEAEHWDRIVEAMPGGDLVQTTAWAQAKRALGFQVCRIVARRGNEIIGGAQVVIKRFGSLGAVGYVARGPLVTDACPERASQVLDEIERAARARRVRHLVVQPPEGGEGIAAQLAARGYEQDAPAVAPTATLRLDLSRDLDRILAGMSATKRRDIRRSQRRGVEVRSGGRGDLDLFHSLYEATARRQGFEAVSRSYLRHHWDALDARGSVRLLLAYHQGRPLAGFWLTGFGDTVTFRLTGWTGEGGNLHPNLACHWAAIQWAKERGYRYYDLGGIERRYAELISAGRPLPDAFLGSPALFKTEFGARPVLLPTASQLTFNPVARLVVRSVYPRLARNAAAQRLIHRLRNG